MTVCRQLNYRSKKNGVYGLYSEELLVDGEIDGRNWSLIERTYLRDVRWHGGKYHYILRIDVSEYQKGYQNLIYDKKAAFNDMHGLLVAHPRGYDLLRFSVNNQSPGLWENGFNPNYWLEAEVGAYADAEDRLRKIIETGRDMRNMNDIGLVVEDSLNEVKPFIKKLAGAAPAEIPYHYWWGDETPPPPRKPIY